MLGSGLVRSLCRLAHKRLLTFVAVFIAVAFGIGLLLDWVDSRDPALRGALVFVEDAIAVDRYTGKPLKTSVAKSLYYQGVPGREEPYREYTIVASGEKGSATVWVRAMGPDSSGAWKYQLRDIERRR